jgi:hypothetical protein
MRGSSARPAGGLQTKLYRLPCERKGRRPDRRLGMTRLRPDRAGGLANLDLVSRLDCSTARPAR